MDVVQQAPGWFCSHLPPATTVSHTRTGTGLLEYDRWRGLQLSHTLGAL